MRRLDLTGRTFGRLTVIASAPARITTAGRSLSVWSCRCECGTGVDVIVDRLTTGHTTSCGCFRHEMAVSRLTRHGYSRTRTHIAWQALIARCTNPNASGYDRYGGKGITVCQRWLDRFENFLADMGEAPTKGHSVDRINNALGYEPANCRWATVIEQANNRTSNVMLTAFGQTKTMQQWANDPICAVCYNILRWRIKQGWEHVAAITSPRQKVRRTA